MVSKESLAFKALWVEKVNLISVVKSFKIQLFCSQITLFLCKVSRGKRKLMKCTEITTGSSISTRSRVSEVSAPPTCSYKTQVSLCSSQNEQNLSSRSSIFRPTCQKMCPETIKTKRSSKRILIFDVFFSDVNNDLDINITLKVINTLVTHAPHHQDGGGDLVELPGDGSRVLVPCLGSWWLVWSPPHLRRTNSTWCPNYIFWRVSWKL